LKDTLRPLPGLVAGKRSSIAALRKVRPLRPPVESPELVARMLVLGDKSFLTGNGFAEHCRYVLNYDALRVNERVENNWWFCNPEFLEYFFRTLAPADDYVLFTANSNVDRGVDERFRRQLDCPRLIAWFAINAELRHPKLFSLPLGVGNPIKCDPVILKRVQRLGLPKTQLFEASFGIATNVAERTHCIAQTGIAPAAKVGPEEHFRRVASAHFCISPNGNGVDCYRTWQALYLRTIPIVTESLLTEQHPELPLIVLRDWSDFRSIDFTPELYERTWGGWDPAEISIDRYLDRVRARINGLEHGRRAETSTIMR
jgi:hypothetical protein